MLVPIDTTPQLLLRVVQMNDLEARDPYDRIECTDDISVPLRGPDVVACRKDVAGIQADTCPFREADLIQQRSDLLKAMPQTGPLASSGLDDHLHLVAFRPLQEFPDAVRP